MHVLPSQHHLLSVFAACAPCLHMAAKICYPAPAWPFDQINVHARLDRGAHRVEWGCDQTVDVRQVLVQICATAWQSQTLPK